jgi:hypothetical protein
VETKAREVITVGFEGEKTSLEVGGDTSLKLLDDAGPGKHLYLAKGRVGATVVPQPAGRPMTVKTPHAEVKVMGTRFWLLAGDEETQLAVFRGRVRFTDARSGGSASVRMGECARAGKEDIFHIEPLRTRGPEPVMERTVEFPRGKMWMTAGLAASEDTLWVTGHRSMLTEIDPETGEVLGQTDLGRVCGRKLRGLAWDGKHLWVGDGDARAVRALDPDTLQVARTVWVNGQVAHLAAGGGSLWVGYRGSRIIDEFDAESGARRGSMSVFPPGYRWGTRGLAYANGALWGMSQQGSIHRVWPVRGFPVVHYPSPDRVMASCIAAAGPGKFWVAVRRKPKVPELRLVRIAVPAQ